MPRPASFPWYRLLTPQVLSAAAIMVGWAGVYFAFRDHWLGLVLPLVTTGLALSALRQGDELARRRSAALREALESAAARNRELDRLRQLAATLLAGTDLPRLVSEVAAAAVDLLQAQGCGVTLEIGRAHV